MDLQCYNDYDKTMDCHFPSVKSNCSEYNLGLKTSDPNDSYSCIFKEIMRSSDVMCSCSISLRDIIISEELTATLRNESFRIHVSESIKPKRPTITRITQSPNGNFWVTWETHYEKIFARTLTTELTYKKTGDINGVSQNTSSTLFEILGEDLEPNTKYVLIIRTYTNISNLFSDSSEEWHFTTRKLKAITPVRSHINYYAQLTGISVISVLAVGSVTVFKMVIISLSIAAISLTCFLFWCFIKLQNKCRDTYLKYPSPILLKIYSTEPWILSPSKTPVCSISVESLKMNGTEGKQLAPQDGSVQREEDHSDADSQGYALTGPLPVSDVTPGNAQVAKIQAELSRVFSNLFVISVDPLKSQSYMNIPNSKPINHFESVMESPAWLTMENTLPCDGGYNSNENKVNFPQIFIGPNPDPTLSTIEESYHPCDNGFVSSSPIEDNLTCKAMKHACSLSASGDDYQALQILQQHNSFQWTFNDCAPQHQTCSSQDVLLLSTSTFPNKVELIDDYHCV